MKSNLIAVTLHLGALIAVIYSSSFRVHDPTNVNNDNQQTCTADNCKTPPQYSIPGIDYFENLKNVKVTFLSKDPLIVQFDDFLEEADISTIKEITTPYLERSTGGLERAVGDYRTSSTAWLMPNLYKNTKYENQVLNLINRIADLTTIPAINQEHFQVLHYGPNQYYKRHHDYITEHMNMPCDVRTATFFIYMNDVESGGGTHFPQLGLTVQPKKGRAALWYNNLNGTQEVDYRTEHEAQPVISGEKWGANVWIHADNFYDNWLKGKTG